VEFVAMSVDDQQLEQLARSLGAKAVAHLDVDETARVVVERLKSEPQSVVWWRRKPQLSAVAAAAVLVLAIGILADTYGHKGGGAELEHDQAPLELQALYDDELEEVLDSLLFEAPVAELAVASLEDMSIGQLEELLQTMMED
jgi:anti-sigma-K factor RskA